MTYFRFSHLLGAILAIWIGTITFYTNDASARPTSARKVGYAKETNHLTVTFGYKDIFSTKIRNKLKSGLQTRLVMQIAVENENGKQVGFWARTIHVVYDLWEENFVVTLKEPGGKRAARVKTIKEVISVCGVMRKKTIATHLPRGKYRLKVVVEANPVSEKMVRNIQRWISKPSGGFQNGGTATNYFGSFVGYFVDRNIAKAEKTIRFNSQWFTL